MTMRVADNNSSSPPKTSSQSSQWERRQDARRPPARRRFGSVSAGQIASYTIGALFWIVVATLIFAPSDKYTEIAAATAHQDQGRAITTFSPSEKGTATTEITPVVQEEQRAARAALPTSGSVGRAGEDGAFACPTPETFKKFLSIGQNDAAMAFRWAVANGCDMIPRGSQVVVEDTNWWGLACVSRIDRPGCLIVNGREIVVD